MTIRTWTLTPGRILAAAGVSLAVALAGCADSDTDEEVRADRTTTSAPANSTVVPTVPSNPTSSAPAATTPPVTEAGPPPTSDGVPATSTIPADLHPHRWEGYSVGADGVTLTFPYYAGVEPCSVFDSIVADESADRVRVTIYERSAGGDTMCIMIAQLKSASVTLAAPLGGRTVIDGAP